MRLRFALVLVAFVSGCGVLGVDDDLEDELISKQHAWQAKNIHSYEYHVRTSCFCPPDRTAEMTVTVRNDAIVSVVNSATGAVRPIQDGYTVDQLFGLIKHAIDSDQDGLTFRYDPLLYYPVTIVFHEEQALDSGLSVTASGLKALTGSN